MSMTAVRVRSLFGGAALAALLLGASACSDDAGSTKNTTGALQQSATVEATGTDAAATTNEIVPVAIDAAATLQTGLAGLTGGYHFLSVVTVNDTESLRAEGDRIGADSRLTLVGPGGTVQYIITPDGSYALPEGGEWEALDVAPATADPITSLQSPSAVATSSVAGDTITLTATVDALQLGIAATGTADVQIVLTGGAITQISYTTPVEGGTAVVRTDVSPLADTTPIVAPI
jgi:hypothetical protein